MTIIEAIKNVMLDVGKPLSPKEAYDLIIKKDLYSFNADNPAGVVRNLIRKHCVGIEFSTSRRTKHFSEKPDGKFYPLDAPIKRPRKNNAISRKTPKKSIAKNISVISEQLKDLHYKYNEAVKVKILKSLKTLTPKGFEDFSNKLMEVYGFNDMKVTQLTRDGGIDGFGKLQVGLAEMNVAFQCKRWTRNNIQRPEIDKFRGAIQGEYEQGVFFTTSSFSSGAKEISIKKGAVPIILIDGVGIVELMNQKEFGVQKESLPIYTSALDLILENDDEDA